MKEITGGCKPREGARGRSVGARGKPGGAGVGREGWEVVIDDEEPGYEGG